MWGANIGPPGKGGRVAVIVRLRRCGAMLICQTITTTEGRMSGEREKERERERENINSNYIKHVKHEFEFTLVQDSPSLWHTFSQ